MANKICIYAMCKNEESNVEKWINSLNSADIICVTDDGSSDRTKELLLKYGGEKVYLWDQSWPDDYFSFGEARNIARAHAQEIIDKIREPEDEWILVNLDFDQFVLDGGLESLKKIWYKGCLGAIVTERQFSNPATDNYHYYKVQNEDLRWHWYGDIHEYLSYGDDPKPYDIYDEDLLDLRNIFIYDHWHLKKGTDEAYYQIGKKALLKNPNDPYLLSCLVDNSFASGHFESTKEYCFKLLNICFNSPGLLYYHNYGGACTWYLYLSSADPENKEKYFNNILNLIDSHLVEPFRRIYVDYGDYLFDENPDQAAIFYEKALSIDPKSPTYPTICEDYWIHREDWRIYQKLTLLYFYKKQDYLKALINSAKTVLEKPLKETIQNLKSCLSFYNIKE